MKSKHLQKAATTLLERWRTVALALACSLFAWNSIIEQVAFRQFASHVDEMRLQGGGVLFVVSAVDCIATASVAAAIAESLKESAIPLRGLMIDGVGEDASLPNILSSANARFPHVLVSAHGVVGHLGVFATPTLLGIGPDGNVAFVERFATVGVRDIPSVVDRLMRAVRPR